jgi:predicted 3-demethylubiquinone-9 3-methyltransferase (glyoxalase superfamily)
MPNIRPCLWFDSEGEEAARFYVSLFKNSRIIDITHYGEAGRPGEPDKVLTVLFELDGREILILNGGPDYKLNEAFSLQIDCETQAEVDTYWNALSDGGAEGPCGWVKDRWGVSWQVVPTALPKLLSDPDPARAGRAMTAMLQMGKLDIEALQRAADGA